MTSLQVYLCAGVLIVFGLGIWAGVCLAPFLIRI